MAESIEVRFPGTRVEDWYYAVPRPDPDTSVRCKLRTGLGTSDETVVILQASRLEPWKGQGVLLEALGLLRDVPGWECWLAGGAQKAGESEFMADLRTAANQAGIAGRVRFLGQRADVPKLMAAADVFCQPNTGPEPFGIVFVEALYAGLPVVTSGFGGAAEIVDQSCGVLTTPDDPESVAAALKGLIGDPSRRRKLGAAGPVRAKGLCDPARQLNAVAVLLRPQGGPTH
jgi:glycosyltransferase involved in cell wall biosynthesis